MKKKFLVTVLVFVAIFAGVAIWAALGGIKYLQFKGAMEQYANMPMRVESVTSQVAAEETWIPALKAIGSTAAVQGVTVSTDQPGIVTKINFESGQMVKEGDLLVQLDVTQEEAQLRSALAQQKLAALNLQRQQNLIKSRVSAQSELDTAQAEYDQATARVLEMKSMVDKKTIRAPFTGVLGIRVVNLGQYLQSGAAVAPLQALDPIYVNFYLPQQNLGEIAAGQTVNVKADGLPEVNFEGKVNAVDAVVDEATRNVRVQATLPNPKGLLRPGMFVNAEVPQSTENRHIVLPSTAIQYAPYGDTVYIIEDMTDPKGQAFKGVRQQVVKIGETRGDRIAILSGVKPGEEVVTSGVFKLRQGAAVSVNNSILPENSEKPTPEDT
jgi:membrane fusion protein (multidrug efflux system)